MIAVVKDVLVSEIHAIVKRPSRSLTIKLPTKIGKDFVLKLRSSRYAKSNRGPTKFKKAINPRLVNLETTSRILPAHQRISMTGEEYKIK